MIKKIVVLVVAFSLASYSASIAAENESWIQKMKNKFQKKEVVEAKKEAPAKYTAPAKEKTPAKEVNKIAAPRKERKDMTKDEFIASIVKNLGREESILNLIPGLVKNSDPEGKEYYVYQGKRLEDLDRDTLDNIYGRTNTESVRLRTDRLNRQMETVRRANAMTVATVPQVPRTPVVQVPRVPVIPIVNTPQGVPGPVQPPKPPAPPAPPAQPRR